MPNENQIALAKYQLDKARQCVTTARSTMLDGDYATSANRSYYSIFHAIRAVMALDGLDFKKHSAVIAKFRELYIKPGYFDVRFSRIIGEAFDLRGDCDYEDFYVVTKQAVEDQLSQAAEFITEVDQFIKGKVAE